MHYNGWHVKWDEWLDVVSANSRIRKLGEALTATPEEIARKQSDDLFRESLLRDQHFTVVDMKADGNCLFRSFGHQIYGNAELHPRVRQECYDYMLQNGDYFALYVDGPLDEYVERGRKNNQWGDHVEIQALRELYNKNVDIYDKGYTKFPKPVGFSSVPGVPVVRLSYHGKSHYNSVLAAGEKLPLGDGRDSAISLGDLRKRDFAVTITPAAETKTASSSPAVANPNNSVIGNRNDGRNTYASV